jgi:ubiquinone/menaquinone biosynthesis C-methylase UbiE
MLRIFRLGLAILLIFWFFRQVGRPRGPLGKTMVRGWNRSHAKLTDWGLQQLIPPENVVMLDVGCGGGRTVSRLSALAPSAKVVGLDVSAASVAVTRETNIGGIESGRVQILQGSVAALPFPSDMFDIVTAVETHYYWPDLAANVKDVLRVLKPGGTFALIAEAYRGGPFRLIYAIIMPLIGAALLSDAEHRDLLIQAGFTEVTTKHVPGKNWICATGCKP